MQPNLIAHVPTFTLKLLQGLVNGKGSGRAIHITIAKIFVRFARTTPSPRTWSGVQILDSCFRRNDEKNACNSGSSRFSISDGQMDIIFGKGYVTVLKSNGGKGRWFGGDAPRRTRGCPSFPRDRLEACPTSLYQAVGATAKTVSEFMVTEGGVVAERHHRPFANSGDTIHNYRRVICQRIRPQRSGQIPRWLGACVYIILWSNPWPTFFLLITPGWPQLMWYTRNLKQNVRTWC